MDLYQKLVEESGEYSYVVDKKNFDMVFANSKITNLKGNSYLGKKCYEYLLNSSKQCEKCVLKDMADSKERKVINFSSILNSSTYESYKQIKYNNRDVVVCTLIKSSDLNEAYEMSSSRELASLREVYDNVKELTNSSVALDDSLNNVIKNINFFYDAYSTSLYYHNTIENKDLLFTSNKDAIKDIYQNIDLDKESLLRQIVTFLRLNSAKDVVVVKDYKNVFLDIADEDKLKSLNSTTTKTIYYPLYSSQNIIVGFISVASPSRNEGIEDYLKIVGMLTNTAITKNIILNNRNSLTSFFDGLTGLSTRTSYLNAINDIKKDTSLPLGVAFVDINGLKKANDKNGHDYGDNLIIQIAETITKIFPRETVYRIGGDEFVVLEKGVSSRNFTKQVNSLRAALETKNGSLASIGAIHEIKGYDVDKMVSKADQYMYRQKQNYYYQEEITSSQDNYLDAMKKVVDEFLDAKNLTVHLSPRFRLSDGKCYGFDVKPRLLRKINNVFSSFELIKFLENTDSRPRFDLHILEICCKIEKKFKEEFNTYPLLHYNLSTSLLDSSFADKAIKLMKKYDIPRNVIGIQIIDINEDFIDTINININKLKDAGCNINLNHFGKLSANISVLQKIKLNSLKLDRSLCENIEKSSQNYDLISGICLLCKRIGVEVIADYISNEKQRELFEELGIKYGRGDLFSPELTLDELIDKFYKTGNYFDFREEEGYL